MNSFDEQMLLRMRHDAECDRLARVRADEREQAAAMLREARTIAYADGRVDGMRQVALLVKADAADTRTIILAALRAELPLLSCYEPSRMIGSPCSCAAGLLRAIEIVEATQ